MDRGFARGQQIPTVSGRVTTTEREFVVGQRIPLRSGKEAIIEDRIASGAQGTVYRVTVDGETKALKWYKSDTPLDRRYESHANILTNSLRPSPASAFLWPEDVSGWQDGSFGYIMQLAPKGYRPAKSILTGTYSFRSYAQCFDALLTIAHSFQQLHAANLSYHDINSGNFLIDVDTGQVLICDTDNIVADGEPSDVLGTEGFSAPEIFRDGALPGINTDRFSLAVFLFLMLCKADPYQGIRFWNAPLLTEKQTRMIYIDNPIFIMQGDQHTQYHPEHQAFAKLMWDCLSPRMRKLFFESLGATSIKNPSSRPTESEWLGALADMRSSISVCPCGNEVFLTNGSDTTCESCGRHIYAPYRFEINGHTTPIFERNLIRKTQLGSCAMTEELEVVGRVMQVGKPTHTDRPSLALRNMSSDTWKRHTRDGKVAPVAPEQQVLLGDGDSISIGNTVVKVYAN